MSFDDSWDPMEEDYHSKSFNSYSSADRIYGNHHRNENRELDYCSIYIRRFPNDVIERKIFLNMIQKYGTLCRHKFLDYPDSTSVLISYISEEEAEAALRGLNRKPPLHLEVQYANKHRDNSNQASVDLNFQMHNSSAQSQNIFRGAGRGQLLNNYDTAELKDIKVVCGNRKRDVISSTAIENRHTQSSPPNRQTQDGYPPARGRGTALNNILKSPTHPLTGYPIHGTNKQKVSSPREMNSNGVSSSSSSSSSNLPELINIALCCQLCRKSSSFCCGTCKTPYCSANCQRQDWPLHARICRAEKKSLSSGSNASDTSQENDYLKSPKKPENHGRFRNSPRQKIELNGKASSRESENAVSPDKPANKSSPRSSNTDLIPNPLQSGRRINTNVPHKPKVQSMRKSCEMKSSEVRNQSHSPEVPTKILRFQHLKKVKIPETGEKVVVCKFDSPFKFWVMKSNDKETLSNIEKQIKLGKNMVQLSCPNMYDLVLALNENGKMCRGVVKQVNIKKMTSNVQLIDYGGEEPINHNNLYLLPEQLVNYPPVAIRCKLCDSEIPNGELSDNEISNLKLLLLEKEFKAHDMNYDGEQCELSLVNADGVSMSSMLALQRSSILLSCLNPNEKQISAPSKIPTIYEDLVVSMELKIGSAVTLKNKVCVYAIDILKIETFKQDFTDITNRLLNVTTEDVSATAKEMDIVVGFSIQFMSWYRCIVLKRNKDTFLVRYIDFGNEEEITKLHKLPENLSIRSSILYCEGDAAFNTECHRAFDKGDYLDAVVAKVGTDCVEVLVVGETQHKVKCYSVYHDLNLSVVSNSKSVPSREPILSPIRPTKKVSMLSDLKKRSLPSNGSVKVILCHAEKGVFYCQLFSDSATLNDLTQKLQKLTEAAVTQPPSVGELYCVKSSDGLWYRGSVEEILQINSFKVCFTDYGNCEEVSLTSFKYLPIEFTLIPALCIPIKVQNIEMVKDFVTPISVKITGSLENGIQIVSIVDAAFDDTEKPLVLKPRELPCDMNSEIIVTYTEKETYFCHMKSDVPEITKMAEKLQTCKNVPLSSAPKLEGLFRVKCSDGLWYRGVVKAVMPGNSSFNINFIDYGNCEEVTLANIQQLPKEFGDYPIFCVPFKFTDSTTLTDLENTVVGVSFSGGIYLVKLVLPKTIFKISSLKMLSLPEKKCSKVKFQVIGKSAFLHSVSHQKDLEKLNDMLQNNKLSNITHSPVVDEVLCGRSKDGRLYRGCIKQILPQNHYKVFYIDYGFSEDIPYKMLFDLSEELLSFPIFCIPAFVQNVALHEKYLSKNRTYTVEPNGNTSDNSQVIHIVNSLPIAALEKSTLKLNEQHEVIFIYTENGVHHLQLKSEFLQISDLVNKLMQCSHKESIIHNPFIGELVCAKSSLDNMWYRGCIMNILPSSDFKVHFIDYGNSEVLKKKDLQCFTEDLAKYPVFGIPVTVTNVSDMPESIQLERLYDIIVESVSKLSSVKIVLKEVLQAANVSIEAAAVVSSMCDTTEFTYGDCTVGDVSTGQQCVVISNVVPQIAFMIVDANVITELDALTRNVTSYCNELQCTTYNGFSIEDGQMVLAKYDNEWFRAVVTETMPDDLYEVYFIDYGNVEHLKKEALRKMEPQFMTLAINAHICDLKGYSPEVLSSPTISQELESFKNIPLEATVEKILSDNGSVSYQLSIPKITQHLVTKLASVQT